MVPLRSSVLSLERQPSNVPPPVPASEPGVPTERGPARPPGPPGCEERPAPFYRVAAAPRGSGAAGESVREWRLAGPPPHGREGAAPPRRGAKEKSSPVGSVVVRCVSVRCRGKWALSRLVLFSEVSA